MRSARRPLILRGGRRDHCGRGSGHRCAEPLGRPDGGGISMGRGGAMESTMRSDLVVDAGEAVELGLQLAMMAAAGRAASQAAPAATLGPDEGVKSLQHCPGIVECRIADQGGRNQLLRSNGLATHGHHRLLTLLTPLPQFILCSAALLPPLAFDCLALPPACYVEDHGHRDVQEAEAELCRCHDAAFHMICHPNHGWVKRCCCWCRAGPRVWVGRLSR
jgi:hypothetical protein